MAEPLTIARPYAEAAFQLAVDDAQHHGTSQLAVWGEGLQALASVVQAPGAEALIANPALSAGQIAQAVIEIADATAVDEKPAPAAPKKTRKSA